MRAPSFLSDDVAKQCRGGVGLVCAQVVWLARRVTRWTARRLGNRSLAERYEEECVLKPFPIDLDEGGSPIREREATTGPRTLGSARIQHGVAKRRETTGANRTIKT